MSRKAREKKRVTVVNKKTFIIFFYNFSKYKNKSSCLYICVFVLGTFLTAENDCSNWIENLSKLKVFH